MVQQVKAEDGTLHEFPDEATPDQMMAAISSSKPAAPAEKPGIMSRIKEGVLGVPATALGDIETVYRMAQGAVQTIPAGLAGIAQGAYNVGAEALGGKPGMPAEKRIEQVQSYGAQPLTQVAKQNMQTIGRVVQPMVEAARAPGTRLAEAGYPTLGTIVGVAPEAAMTILAPESRSAMGSVFRGAEKAAAPAAAAGSAAAGRAAAEQFANTNLQTPWKDLPEQMKATLSAIAAEGKDLTKLDAKALDRQAQVGRLGITKVSKGQLTRDPLQQRREQMLIASEAGNDLRQAAMENNKILLDNVTDLGKGTTGKGKLQVGQTVQGFFRDQLAKANKAVRAAYKAAKDAGELQGPVESQPFLDYLNTHGDPEFVNFAGNKLKAIGAAVEKDGKLTQVRPVTLEEMETLYKAASARQKAGGTQGHYAREVKDQINAITEGAGGDLYKAARSLRNQMGEKFERTQAISQLVRNRKMSTDRATKLEDTWRKTVVNGGSEDLAKVRTALIKGGRQGRQAWNDLRGATADYIVEKATGGGELGLKDKSGVLHLNWNGLRNAVQAIGQDKLTMLYGKAGYQKLVDIVESAQILKTEAPSGVKGSNTFDKIVTFMDKAGAIPIVGGVSDVAVQGAKAVRKLASIGKEGREARSALVTPLTATARKGQTLKSLGRGVQSVKKAYAPTIAVTRGAQEQQ